MVEGDQNSDLSSTELFSTNKLTDESSSEIALSEVHLQRELDDAGIRGCADVARGYTDRRASAAKRAVGEGHVRIRPLRVIEQVEEFRAELKVESLVRRHWIEVFDQARINVPEIGATPRSFAHVPIRSRCRLCEEGCVEPGHAVLCSRASSALA